MKTWVINDIRMQQYHTLHINIEGIILCHLSVITNTIVKTLLMGLL